MIRILSSLCLIIAIFLQTACTGEIWGGSKYHSRMSSAYDLVERGDYEGAHLTCGKMKNIIEDEYIYSLDMGMLLHRAGRYDQSYQRYYDAFNKVIFAAEHDIDPNSFYAQISDQGMRRHLADRYSYGLQWMGTSAKYHPAAFEVGRMATYQMLNGLLLDDPNRTLLALTRLSDINQYKSSYMPSFSFLNFTFSDWLSMMYFKDVADDAGSAQLAYSRITTRLDHISSIFKQENFVQEYIQPLANNLSELDNKYESRLKTDLHVFTKGENSRLTKSDVLSTRLAKQGHYNKIQELILEDINDVWFDIQDNYKTRIERTRSFFSKNKEKLIGNASCATSYTTDLYVVFEIGNAPRIRPNTDGDIGFPRIDTQKGSYSELFEVTLKGQTVEKVDAWCVCDYRLHTLLDFFSCSKVYTRRIVSNIKSLEWDLCFGIEEYYDELDRLYLYLRNANNKRLHKYYKEQILKLKNKEHERRQKFYNEALQKLKKLVIDERGWYSQPSRIYMAPFLDIKPGVSEIQYIDTNGVARTKEVRIKPNRVNVICIQN